MKENLKFALVMVGAVLCRATFSQRLMNWYFSAVVLNLYPGGCGISVGEE